MDRKRQSEYQDQDQSQSSQPSSNEYALIPYVPVDGVWTVPESFLIDVFYKLITNDLRDVVFWHGGMGSVADFLEFCQSDRTHLAFVVDQDERCAGFIWLTDVHSGYAFAHVCLFPSVWGQTERIGKQGLDYWFSWKDERGQPLLDTLIGIFPGFNEHVANFGVKLGFTRLGSIPNMLRNENGDRADAVVFYLSRDDYGKKQ